MRYGILWVFAALYLHALQNIWTRRVIQVWTLSHKWTSHVTHIWALWHMWTSLVTHVNICHAYVTHMNESCRTHMSNVTHMNESSHTLEQVTSHTCLSREKSRHTHAWVMCFTYMSRVLRVNGSHILSSMSHTYAPCHTCEHGMSHTCQITPTL